MGTVVVLDSDAVMALINNGVINGTINGSGELVLEKQSTATVNLGNIKDHGGLTGRSDDDHLLYALADGSRGDFASVAQGAAADAARVDTAAQIELMGDGTNQFLEEVTVQDDGTSTSGWVNRIVGYFRHRVGGVPVADNLRRLVFWFNEYLELRLAPAKHNTVALRLFVRDTATTQTNTRDADVPIMQMMDDRGIRTPIWGLYPNGNIRVGASEVPTVHTILLGPTDPIPTGTPAGTIVVRTT